MDYCELFWTMEISLFMLTQLFFRPLKGLSDQVQRYVPVYVS